MSDRAAATVKALSRKYLWPAPPRWRPPPVRSSDTHCHWACGCSCAGRRIRCHGHFCPRSQLRNVSNKLMSAPNSAMITAARVVKQHFVCKRWTIERAGENSAVQSQEFSQLRGVATAVDSRSEKL
jgi:hypothetical protein